MPVLYPSQLQYYDCVYRSQSLTKNKKTLLNLQSKDLSFSNKSIFRIPTSLHPNDEDL